MSILDIILLAVSLAMDCFTVSIVSGAILRRWQGGIIFRIAVLFGLFQALMPLIGWTAMRLFAAHVEAYGHWIAFAMLLFIGGRMIWESLHGSGDEPSFRPEKLSTQLLLAVATSIDALAVGVSMAVIGYDTLHSLLLPLVIIGLVSLLFALLGHWLGIRFGRAASSRFSPELFGGIILVAIGLKVLLW
jgi:putative Mn2+ efflux pump MntP